MISLITDIDGTLVGDEAALSFFNKFLKPFRDQVYLVYATGRSKREYDDVIKREGLLLPEAAIINTGADIFIKKSGQYIHDHEWHERIKDPSWSAEKVMETLKGVDSITLQDHRNAHKVSYFTVIGEEAAVREKAAAALSAAGIKAKVIISGGTYLDVLPEKCDKGEAAVFLAGKEKIDSGRVITAGDSENDLDLLLKFDKGIVVSNALAGLKEKLKDKGFYFARGAFAAGLQEGMKYYIDRGIFE